jgi:hypothetical protein
MKMNSDYLLDVYQLLSREIKIAKQQTDARAQAYFKLDRLQEQQKNCWKEIDQQIPDEFILQIAILIN